MSTPATLQHTVHIRPSRLAGLLLVVATVTSATTWSVSNMADSTRGSAKPVAATSTYVDEVTSLTPAQRAAMYGNVPANQQRAEDISAMSADQQAAIYGNVSPAQQYIEGVVGMSAEQRSATFGNVPVPDSTP